MRPRVLVQIPSDQLNVLLTDDAMREFISFCDIIWNPFNRPLTPDELRDYIKNVDAVVTTWGSTPITEDIANAAQDLRLIAHFAGAVKPVLEPSVFNHGITVLNSSYALAVSVSESVLALILAIGHKIVEVNHDMQNGVLWRQRDVWELRGATLGLVGLGLTAREVVKILEPFGCKIIAYDPFISAERARELNVDLVPLDEVITRSDVLSIHAPKIPETYHMIGKRELEMIRDGAILVNTARGSVIDEQALIDELNKKRFFAALDVFEQEPLPPDSPLRQMDNVLVRPHMAGFNAHTKLRVGTLMVEDMRRFFNNETPRFKVRPEQLAIMT